jgi:hypothetical protein
VWLGLVAVEVPPSPKVQLWVLMLLSASVDVSVKVAVRPLEVVVKFATGAVLVLPPVTMACEIAHEFVSFDQLACWAKVPVLNATLAAPPAEPAAIQAHSSEFS